MARTKITTQAFLSRLPLFEELAPEELDRIAAGTTELHVPRGEIIAISESASFEEIVAIFADAGHSRLPVYRETLDEVVGMIHVKDVFAVLAEGRTPPPLLDLLRQPLYVPQSMGVLDLLAEMRAKRTHLAIVIDEYSGTDGLVTIEDLVEEIVGEIDDEHDIAETATIKVLRDGTVEALARTSIEDFEQRFGNVFVEDERDNIDTLGGLVFSLAGRIPERGELIRHPSGIEFEVVDVDPRRIRRLRIRHLPPPPSPSEPRGK